MPTRNDAAQGCVLRRDYVMDEKSPVYHEYSEMFKAGEEIYSLSKALMEDVNEKEIKLFDLPAHKRIFLFILTRAMKTFSAINILCQAGYGQDVAPLVRSLMENFITAQYIIHDRAQADVLARRFVEYKWVLFRRSLAEEEIVLRDAPEERRRDFQKKRALIIKNVEDFKKKYDVISDKSLLTWSGKTLKDMARQVSKDLMHEYESTFRLCSRFSHPTILGDSEYIIRDDKTLTFSSLPTKVGISANYCSALHFFIEFVSLINDLFGLTRGEDISSLKQKFNSFLNKITQPEQPAAAQPPGSSTPLREVKIHFDV